MGYSFVYTERDARKTSLRYQITIQNSKIDD